VRHGYVSIVVNINFFIHIDGDFFSMFTNVNANYAFVCFDVELILNGGRQLCRNAFKQINVLI
jgi:hypothetical protein